jgi:hypothetical protein
MLRMSRRTPRTSLRSHSTCHSQLNFVFFFLLRMSSKFCSRDRVINAPCVFRSAVSRRPCRAPFFIIFRVLLRVDFLSFLSSRTTFFVIYIIINTSLTSSHHQNLLSPHHEIVKTRQHTKNGQKWLFLRVLEKGLKMAVFGLFLNSSKIDAFLTPTHHQHIKK